MDEKIGGEKLMGGRTKHETRCPFCGVVVKEMVYDKRDSRLKCDDCYKVKK